MQRRRKRDRPKQSKTERNTEVRKSSLRTQNSQRPSKTIIAGLSIAAIVGLFYAAIRWSLAEHADDLPPIQSHVSGYLVQKVDLDSFDPDTHVVNASATVYVRRTPIRETHTSLQLSTEKYRTPFFCLPDAPYSISFDPDTAYYGPMEFRDIGKDASEFGLGVIQGWPLWGPCVPDNAYVRGKAPSAKAQLYAIGNPRLYPFDSYLIMADVYSPVLLKSNETEYVGIEAFNMVDSELSGFVMRYPSPDEIERRIDRESGLARSGVAHYDARKWQGRKVAIIIERPRFLRVLTITLGAFAVAALFFLVVTSPQERVVTDVIGYLISLWALRSILAVSAPKSPTHLDYAVLALYGLAFVALLGRLWLFEPRNTPHPPDGESQNQSI